MFYDGVDFKDGDSVFLNGLIRYYLEKNFFFKFFIKYKWNFIWDVGKLSLMDYLFFFK